MLLDQLARFDAIMPLVREVNGRTLLDVGSGSRGFGALVGAPWEVTAVDADFGDYGGADGPVDDHVRRIAADTRSLPFPDRSFDVVVAIDLLEHIDPSDRPSVMAELGRVTRGRLVVACPAGGDALDADQRLARYLERRGRDVPGWLVEHLEAGFPEPAEITKGLRPVGAVEVRPNESIAARDSLLRLQSNRVGGWLSRVAGAVLSGGVGRGGPRSALLRHLRGRDRAPTYRAIAVSDRDPDAVAPGG